jgi:hypothetical protein
MATITGDHVGYPGFQDLGNFSPRRKNFGGAKIPTSFGVEFCHYVLIFNDLLWKNYFFETILFNVTKLLSLSN